MSHKSDMVPEIASGTRAASIQGLEEVCWLGGPQKWSRSQRIINRLAGVLQSLRKPPVNRPTQAGLSVKL